MSTNNKLFEKMLNYMFNVELFLKHVLLFITNNRHYDFWVLGLPEADQFKISETNKIRHTQTIAILNKHSQFKCSIFHSKRHLHSLCLWARILDKRTECTTDPNYPSYF